MLHVASLRRGTMGQVVRSSAGSVGASKCAVAEAELKRLRGELRKLRKEIDSRASVREDKETQLRSADYDAKEIHRLRIEIKRLTEAREADRTRTLDEKERVYADLRKVIAEKNKEQSVLVAQIEETKRQVEISNELVSRYLEKIHALESERGESDRKITKKHSHTVKVHELTRKMEAERHENTRLKVRLANLRSDHQAASKKAAERNESEVRRLTEERSAIQSRLDEANRESSVLQEQLGKLTNVDKEKDARIANLARSYEENNTRLIELTKSLQEENTNNIANLEARLSTLNREIASIIQQAKKDHDQAQVQLSQLSSENDGLRDELMRANKTIEENLAKINQSSDLYKSLELDANDTKKKVRELTNENHQLRSQLAALQQDLDDKQRLVKDQQDTSTNNAQEINKLQNEIQQIKSLIKEREEQISSLKSKLSEYEATMNSILQEQSTCSDDLSSTIPKITRLLEEANESKTEMSKKLSESTVRVATIQSELVNANEKVRALDSRVGHLEQKKESLETEVHMYKGRIKESEEKSRVTGEQNTRLVLKKEAHIADLSAKLERKTAELSGMDDTLKRKELELETRKSRLSNITESLDKEQNELAKLKVNLDDLSGRILNQSALQQQIKSATESLNVQSQRNTNLQNQVDAAKSKLSEVEKEASVLKDMLSRVKHAASCDDSINIVACIKGKMEHHNGLVKELQQCKKKAAASSNKLNSQIRTMQSSIDTKEESIRTVKLEIERLKNERTLDQESHSQQTRQISDLQKRAALLTDQLNAANDGIKILKTSSEEAAKNAEKEIAVINESIARNLRKHESELYRANAELEKKKTELAESHEKANGLQKRLEEATKSSDSSNQERDKLRTDLHERTAEVDRMRQEIATFQVQLTSLATSHEEAKARYEATQTTLREINDEVDEVLGATAKRSDDLESEDSAAEHTAERISAMTKEYRSNQFTLSALGEKAQCKTGSSKEDVINCLNRTIDVSNAVKETIDPNGESAVENIKDKIKGLIQREKQWEEDVTKTKAKNVELVRQNIEFNKKQGDLQEELGRCKDGMRAMESALNSERARSIAISSKLEALEINDRENLEALKADIARREDDQAKAKQLTIDLSRKITELEEQLKQANLEKQDISMSNHELTQSLGKCNKSLTAAIEQNANIRELENELENARQDLMETEIQKNELEKEAALLKLQVNETMNRCLLGLTLKEVPIIDSGIPAAVRETAGELISHYERNATQTDRGRVDAFKLIETSVREFIRSGSLAVLPLGESKNGDKARELLIKHIKGIRELIKGYVHKSDVMVKMPSNTIALSMRRLTENIISVAKSAMFQSKYDNLRKNLSSITAAAEMTMANDITGIINKAFDAALGANTASSEGRTQHTWGSLIQEHAGEVRVLVGIPDDMYDMYHDTTKTEDESPDDSDMEQDVIKESRLEIVGKLSAMMDSSDSRNPHELECILFLTYIIGMDLIGGSENGNENESNMYRNAGTLLKQNLRLLKAETEHYDEDTEADAAAHTTDRSSRRFTRSNRQASTRNQAPVESRSDGYPGVKVDLEKLISHIQTRMSQSDIEPNITNLTNKITKEMHHTREDGGRVIPRVYLEIEQLMIQAESYNTFHITKSRSSTPIPAPRSLKFGLYV